MKYRTKFMLCMLQAAFFMHSGAALAQTGIEEIVVTAQKRAESLADVPIAITALTPDELDSDNIKNVVELSSRAPGLIIAKHEGFSRSAAIRGIGYETTQNISGIPSVAFHIDGVFIADPNALNLDFIDVDRIEVLRGPQGTVFGQNSTGGTINVVNMAPQLNEFSGRLDMAVGNYELIQPRATINVPLGETVALRASGTYLKHDGFSEITGGPQDGYRLDEEDNSQFQAKLLWQPSDNFAATLSGTNFSINNVSDRAQRHVDDDSGDIRDVQQDTAGEYDSDSRILSLTLEWVTPMATIKSITGYVENDQFTFHDSDRGIPRFAGLKSDSISTRDSETWTQEINIVSNTEGALDWILGGFYMDYEKKVFFDDYVDGRGGGAVDNVLSGWKGPAQVSSDCQGFGNPTNERSFCVNTLGGRESWSIYGQGTYHLTEALRLTGGIRYTEDNLSAVVRSFGADPGIMYDEHDSEVTGKAGVELDIGEPLMVYFSWTRGFKPGVNNLSTSPVLVPQLSKAEKVDAFEIGAKGRFMQDRLQVFASAFYYEYKNMLFLTEDPAPFQGGVDNAPKSEVLGAELELEMLLADGFSIDAGFSFLDTEITADKQALDPVLVAGNFDTSARSGFLQNINGNPLPKAPDFSMNVSLNYAVDMPLGELNSRLSFTHRDSFASRVFSSGRLDDTPGYDLLNASIDLTPANYPNVNLGLLVINLTDEEAVNSRWTNNYGVQSTSEEFVAPRQFIGRVSYSF